MAEQNALHDAVCVLQDGCVISFCDYGVQHGIPIFLFHGTPGSRLFGLDQQELSEAGIHILTPERPGYGRSTAKENTSLVEWALDIRQLADQLGLGRFHVLGISGGGPFALACAAILQSRVISATLVSSIGCIELPGFWNGMSLGNKAVFFAARKIPSVLPGICSAIVCIERLNTHCHSATPTHEGEAFRQGGIGLYTDLRLTTTNWGIDLKGISVPVILWHGEQDVLAPIASAKALADAIPSSEAHFLPGYGHFVNRDAAISEKIFERLLSYGE